MFKAMDRTLMDGTLLRILRQACKNENELTMTMTHQVQRALAGVMLQLRTYVGYAPQPLVGPAAQATSNSQDDEPCSKNTAVTRTRYA